MFGMNNLVAALYGVESDSAAAALLTAYKLLQEQAAKAVAGHVDLAELDAVITHLATARERHLIALPSDGYRQCTVNIFYDRSGPTCLRVEDHSGSHWFLQIWPGITPEQDGGPIIVRAEDLVASGIHAASQVMRAEYADSLVMRAQHAASQVMRAEQESCTCGVGVSTLGTPHADGCQAEEAGK